MPVLVLGGLAAVVFLTRADEEAAVVDEIEASGACTYDTVTDGDPPAGGSPADADPAAPGFYLPGDDTPGDRPLVRAMRQGFVVLWYDPDLPTDQLSGLSDRFGRDLILVPRPGLREPVVVTAWERRLVCATYSEPAIARFVEEFRDEGPEKGFL